MPGGGFDLKKNQDRIVRLYIDELLVQVRSDW